MKSEIRSVVQRFASAFTTKDWDALKDILCATILVDYSDIGQEKAEETAEEFVNKRKALYTDLDVHYLITPLKIGVNNTQALCKAYSVIYRTQKFRFYNTHATYVFGCVLENGVWKIRSIKQGIICNEGLDQMYKLSN